MVVDKRIYAVLNALIQNPSMSGVELQSKFGLTRKQLSYTIKKINDFLESSGIERLSLIHLSSSLTVSQNTVVNDLKKAQTVIDQHCLQVTYDRENGYRIVGNEVNKRYLLLNLIRRIIHIPIADKIFRYNDIITQGRLEHIGIVFSEIEKKLKIIFTDEQLQELTG